MCHLKVSASFLISASIHLFLSLKHTFSHVAYLSLSFCFHHLLCPPIHTLSHAVSLSLSLSPSFLVCMFSSNNSAGFCETQQTHTAFDLCRLIIKDFGIPPYPRTRCFHSFFLLFLVLSYDHSVCALPSL